MINNNISYCLTLTFWVKSLRSELHSFCGTWLRCNFLEWNDHSASLRLALHPKNRTLHPVQLPDLGLSNIMFIGAGVFYPLKLMDLNNCSAY